MADFSPEEEGKKINLLVIFQKPSKSKSRRLISASTYEELLEGIQNHPSVQGHVIAGYFVDSLLGDDPKVMEPELWECIVHGDGIARVELTKLDSPSPEKIIKNPASEEGLDSPSPKKIVKKPASLDEDLDTFESAESGSPASLVLSTKSAFEDETDAVKDEKMATSCESVDDRETKIASKDDIEDVTEEATETPTKDANENEKEASPSPKATPQDAIEVATKFADEDEDMAATLPTTPMDDTTVDRMLAPSIPSTVSNMDDTVDANDPIAMADAMADTTETQDFRRETINYAQDDDKSSSSGSEFDSSSNPTVSTRELMEEAVDLANAAAALVDDSDIAALCQSFPGKSDDEEEEECRYATCEETSPADVILSRNGEVNDFRTVSEHFTSPKAKSEETAWEESSPTQQAPTPRNKGDFLDTEVSYQPAIHKTSSDKVKSSKGAMSPRKMANMGLLKIKPTKSAKNSPERSPTIPLAKASPRGEMPLPKRKRKDTEQGSPIMTKSSPRFDPSKNPKMASPRTMLSNSYVATVTKTMASPRTMWSNSYAATAMPSPRTVRSNCNTEAGEPKKVLKKKKSASIAPVNPKQSSTPSSPCGSVMSVASSTLSMASASTRSSICSLAKTVRRKSAGVGVTSKAPRGKDVKARSYKDRDLEKATKKAEDAESCKPEKSQKGSARGLRTVTPTKTTGSTPRVAMPSRSFTPTKIMSARATTSPAIRPMTPTAVGSGKSTPLNGSTPTKRSTSHKLKAQNYISPSSRSASQSMTMIGETTTANGSFIQFRTSPIPNPSHVGINFARQVSPLRTEQLRHTIPSEQRSTSDLRAPPAVYGPVDVSSNATVTLLNQLSSQTLADKAKVLEQQLKLQADAMAILMQEFAGSDDAAGLSDIHTDYLKLREKLLGHAESEQVSNGSFGKREVIRLDAILTNVSDGINKQCMPSVPEGTVKEEHEWAMDTIPKLGDSDLIREMRSDIILACLHAAYLKGQKEGQSFNSDTIGIA